jgi:hypothetical protein
MCGETTTTRENSFGIHARDNSGGDTLTTKLPGSQKKSVHQSTDFTRDFPKWATTASFMDAESCLNPSMVEPFKDWTLSKDSLLQSFLL